MGNFFVIVPSTAAPDVPKTIFHSGLDIAQSLKFEAPSKLLENEWVCAASFPRKNGTGTPVVRDTYTGCWLLTAGSWFHSAGYGSGAESRLLDRYLTVGPAQLANEVEGFFVIIIGDARARETIAITDLVGSCHCFVRKFTFGTALSGSSLLLAGLADFALDPAGCQEFLATGVIYEDRTIYKEVRKLAPASVYRFVGGNLTETQPYWNFGNLRTQSGDIDVAAQKLWESLVCAAQRVVKIFPRPVCDLTGGYDSRALVAAFLASSSSFATVVAGPAESADVVVSSQLAKLVGLPHMHLEPREPVRFDDLAQALTLTDGEYNLIEYAQVMRIHEALMERFDISINGSFGEIARGYWWELLFPRVGAQRKLDARKLGRLRYAAATYDDRLFPMETKLDLASHFAGVIEKTNTGLSALPNTAQMDHAYLMMRMQRWQGRIATSTNRIWPCLSPFLFRSVLECMLQARVRFRRRSLLIRKMLVEFQPTIANFPLEHGYPAVPLRGGNLYRFRPLASHYAGKIYSRVARLVRGYLRKPAQGSTGPTPRQQLWTQAEVQQLLNAPTMRIAEILDQTFLSDFLAKSRQYDFRFEDQWSRLLTLEYTLAELSHMRKNRKPGSMLGTDWRPSPE